MTDGTLLLLLVVWLVGSSGPGFESVGSSREGEMVVQFEMMKCLRRMRKTLTHLPTSFYPVYIPEEKVRDEES